MPNYGRRKRTRVGIKVARGRHALTNRMPSWNLHELFNVALYHCPLSFSLYPFQEREIKKVIHVGSFDFLLEDFLVIRRVYPSVLKGVPRMAFL